MANLQQAVLKGRQDLLVAAVRDVLADGVDDTIADAVAAAVGDLDLYTKAEVDGLLEAIDLRLAALETPEE